MCEALFEDIPEGATITELRPLPSDPNVRSIRVGRRAVARLRIADVESLGLEVGQPWTEELAAAVQRALAVNKARKVALRLIGRRAYSSGELVDRLVRREHDRSVAELIVDELVDDGWMDDRAYAEAVTRELLARSPATKRLIVAKLRQRKIDRELAEQVAAEALKDSDPSAEATEFARKKLRAMGDIPKATAARRIAGALSRRGFNGEAVYSALEALGLMDA
jgi:regulatory protein